MNEIFLRIADAALIMTRTFLCCGLKPPEAVLLASKRDALIIIHSARHANVTTFDADKALSPRNVYEFNGVPCGMFELCGVKYYWPLEKFALPSGGYSYR